MEKKKYFIEGKITGNAKVYGKAKVFPELKTQEEINREGASRIWRALLSLLSR